MLLTFPLARIATVPVPLKLTHARHVYDGAEPDGAARVLLPRTNDPASVTACVLPLIVIAVVAEEPVLMTQSPVVSAVSEQAVPVVVPVDNELIVCLS